MNRDKLRIDARTSLLDVAARCGLQRCHWASPVANGTEAERGFRDGEADEDGPLPGACRATGFGSMDLALFDYVPDVVVVYGEEGSPVYVNGAFASLLGHSLGSLEKDRFGFIVEEDRATMEAKFRQTLAGEPVQRWETRCVSRTGRLLDTMVSMSRLRSDDEGGAGVVVIVQDITAQKNAQRKLARECRLLARILDSAPLAVGLLDDDENLVYVNSALSDICGYSLEEIGNLRNWFVLAYPDPEERQRAINAWKRGSQGRMEDRIFQLTSKDGSRKWVEFRRKTLPGQGAVVNLSDVTEEARVQEQIRQAKKEWERTFDSIEYFVTIQNTKFQLMRVNRAAANAIGVQPSALIGRNCYQLFCSENGPPANCPGRQVLLDGRPHTAEIVSSVLRRHLLISVWPLTDDAGELVGYVHVARDVSEQRKMEQELQKMEKLESLGILAGGLAHDFNNILTAILGNISMAKIFASDDNEMVVQKLEKAEEAALAARDLTQQLLTFAKGGAPMLRTESLAEVIRESVDFASRGSKVSVDCDIADDLWFVEADKKQISTVINNIIINAVQAMPEGGKVRVHAENLMLERHAKARLSGPCVKISIADEGVGIEKERLKKIFDPFFTTKPNGSGLGLSTAYSIVKRHRGCLRVESEVGVGTVFHVYLPATGKRAGVSEKEDKEETTLQGEGRVLLMDDEALIREIGGEMLEFMGYEVELAVDGKEALERYQAARERGDPFDVVIMDLTVPGGMGGEEAMRRLLQIDPSAKAIVSSGYSNDPIMSRYGEYGFRGVVVKPYKMQELAAIMGRLVKGD